MAHLNHSQTHSSATGSQEYYNPQRRRSESPYDMNGSAGGTYGSPGSISDYKQALANLRREVEERRKNEVELQQTVNMLKAQYTASSANFLDPQFMGPEGSSGSDNVDENLKDAQIKHLQRQVTVLQANLYKAGGWDSRASNAAKEKYQAMDEVTELKSQLNKMKEENEDLRRRNEELMSAYHNAQQTLRQMEEQGFLPHDRDKLMDEIGKQKIEIRTLKESLTRLDHENRTMKDTGSYDSNQGANSCAYSQELDYLHKVVDTLKKTVLDQRNCLLGMRHSGLGNSSSLPSSKSSGADGTHIGFGRRNNSSPTLDAAKSSAGASSAYRHHSPVAAPRTSITKENSQQSSQLGSQRMEGSFSRKLSSREMLEESEFDPLNSPKLIVYHDEGAALGSGKPRQEVGGVKYPISSQGYNILVNSSEESTPTPHGLQQTLGASSAQGGTNSSSNFSNGYVPMSSQQRKVSQSEILGRRNVPEQSVRSKTEIYGRNPEIVQQETRKPPQWNYGMVEKDVSNGTVGETSPRHFPTSSAPQQQVFMAAGLSAQAQLSSQGRLYETSQGRTYETTPAPQETLLPEWDNGGAMNRNMVNTIQHVNTNVSGSQNNQIFHPPSTYHDASVRVVNQDMMAGGRMTVPPPSPHGGARSDLGQQNLYVNMARSGPEMPAAEVNTRHRLTSDRLCPVCNRDFSHVSMEDFQTHVFECFDDENAPETMKPQTQPTPDKTCPMCLAKFSPTTSQSDYEKHVHSHFGEEGPGDNFEILQP